MATPESGTKKLSAIDLADKFVNDAPATAYNSDVINVVIVGIEDQVCKLFKTLTYDTNEGLEALVNVSGANGHNVATLDLKRCIEQRKTILEKYNGLGMTLPLYVILKERTGDRFVFVDSFEKFSRKIDACVIATTQAIRRLNGGMVSDVITPSGYKPTKEEIEEFRGLK